MQGRIRKFVESGQLGPFANGYWGHPEYRLPPDLNLLAVAHYLEALEMQKEASTVVAQLGGKMPMHMSTPPGGTTFIPTVEVMDNAIWRLKKIQHWVDTVFLPDVLAIAPYYLKWAGIGKGVGNYLSWGVFEDASFDPKKRLLPRGAIYGGKLAVADVDAPVAEALQRVEEALGGAAPEARGRRDLRDGQRPVGGTHGVEDAHGLLDRIDEEARITLRGELLAAIGAVDGVGGGFNIALAARAFEGGGGDKLVHAHIRIIKM